MKNISRKIYATCLIPLIPISFIIDYLIGDAVTGIKASAKDKLKDHEKAWLDIWGV